MSCRNYAWVAAQNRERREIMRARAEAGAALGGPWDAIGEAIVRGGQEDSSGLRRYVATLLREGDVSGAMGELRASEADVLALLEFLVAAWDEPDTAARLKAEHEARVRAEALIGRHQLVDVGAIRAGNNAGAT
jgi:hypothetical protein